MMKPLKKSGRALWGALLLLVMLTCGLMGIGATAANAATLTVTNANDTGAGSLRATLTGAASNDVVIFDPLFFNVVRTITIGSASTPMQINNKTLRVIGPGSGKLTISGGGISRILESWNSNDAENVYDVVISGIKFINGNGASSRFVGEGGAIENENKMVLTDCVFQSNTTTKAGGCVDSYGANLTCRNCVFDSNSSGSVSGGCLLLASDGATLTSTCIIDNCVFTNNSASYGAALYLDGGSGTASAANSLTVTCTNSTFANNAATTYGPAMFSTTGNTRSIAVTFRNCTVTNNTGNAGVSTQNSGAFYVQASANFQNCTIADNQLYGIYCQGGSNSSNPQPTFNVTGSIVYNNSSGDIIRVTGGSTPGTLNVSNTLYGSVTNINGTNSGNITGQNPALGALGNNGGFVQTRAIGSGSPAFNTGSNAGGASTDARGFPRSVGATDMGAYEFGGTTFDFVGVLNPPNTALGVARDTNLVMNFGSASNIVAGTGNIDIKKFSDNSTFESIPVSDARVTISSGVVTINPSGALAANTQYYVVMPAGAFKDTSNNTINANFTTNAAWSFTTSSALITPSPTVTGISPTSGPTAGSTSVTITGTNFTGVTAVKFGSTNATNFTVNSSTSITATSPAGTGTVDVTVTTSSGTSATSAVDQFTYVTPPNLSINDVAANEDNSGTTTLTFTVSLSSPAGSGGVTFNIATANNTAIAPGDYTAKSLTSQTIAAGNSNYFFSVTVNGDTTFEPNETFFVNVTGVTSATVTDAQGQGTINNDDAAPTVNIGNASISEGNAGTQTLNLPATLSATAGVDVIVNYSTSNVTATTADNDYVGVTNGSVTISAGQLSNNIPITINGDTALETDETFTVTINSTTNATAGTSGTGTITADDFETPSLIVTTTGDSSTTIDNLTSLREAINYANKDGVDSTISFDPTVFATKQTISITAGNLPDFTTTATVSGTNTGGVTIERSNPGAGNFVFTNAGGTISLDHLTLSGGDAALSNASGTATVTSCTFSGNTSAVQNNGTLFLTNCTLAGNSARGLINSANTATVNSCTFTNNGIGIDIQDGMVALTNSVVAGNTNANVSSVGNGTLDDQGFNITTGTAAQAGLDTGLKDNGGLTQTIALLTGSPAINTGNTNLTEDQRDITRPQGSASDIGAYEVDKFLSVSIAPTFSNTFSEVAGPNVTQVRITRTGSTRVALPITLRSSDTGEATITSSATIAAGDSFVDVPVDAVDDAITDGTQSVLIKATATGYVPEKVTLSVTDNEVPPSNLSLRLLPSAFSEAKAGTAATLVIQHDRTSLATAVNVNLSRNDTRLNLPNSVQIPAGKRSVEVAITVTADNLLTGTKSATITADATNFTAANTTATIYDAQARISLSLAPGQSGTIKEGATNNQTTLRVTRNTPSTGTVTVTLSLNKGAGQVSYPSSVTIADGASYADFIVSSIDDSAIDGTQSVVVQGAATGYGSSTAQLYVQDNDAAGFSAFKAPDEPSK